MEDGIDLNQLEELKEELETLKKELEKDNLCNVNRSMSKIDLQMEAMLKVRDKAKNVYKKLSKEPTE